MDRFNTYSVNLSTLALILLILLAWMLPKAGISQTDSVAGSTRIDKKYVVSYWHDTKGIARAPFHWKGKQWGQFAGVVGAGLITYVYDAEIYDFFQGNRTSTTDAISKYVIEPWGRGLYSIPLLAGIYFTGAKDSRHRRIALTGVKAFVLSGGAAFVTKHLFHRHRPSDNDPPDPRKWDGPFPFTASYTSFPSGHTTTAFAIAAVLAMGYPDKMWIGISSYTVASLVGISRIHDGHHWGSDVLAGAALGTFIGVTLSKLNFKNVAVSPAAFQGGQGIRVSILINGS